MKSVAGFVTKIAIPKDRSLISICRKEGGKKINSEFVQSDKNLRDRINCLL